MSTNRILMGVLVGFAAGAITGILVAPDKGSRTRQKIKDMGEDYVQHLKSTLNEHMDTLADKYSNLLGYAEALVHKGKAKVEEPKKEMEKSVSDFKRLTS